MEDNNLFDTFDEEATTNANILDSMAPVASADRTPVATIRNKAAAIAMLKGGDTVQSYRDVIAHAESGKPISESPLAQAVDVNTQDLDLKGTMSVLSDSSVPFETKKQAIQNFRKPSPINSHTGVLLSQAIAADNEGETEQEEQARTSITENMRDAIEQRIKQQQLINNFKIGTNPDYNKALREAIVGELVPGFMSEMSARMEEGSLWEKTKAALGPGTTIRKEQEKLLELPPREATAKIMGLIDRLKDLDGFLISDDDTYNKLQYLQNYADGSVMSTPEEVLLNLDPWLSVLGLAATQTVKGKIALRMRSNKEALEAAKKVVGSPSIPEEIKSTVKASKGLPEAPVSKVSVPDQAVAAKAKQIASLEKQKADLLGDVNLAGKGDVRNIQAELSALEKPTTTASELAATLKKGNPRLSAKDARVEAAKRVDEEMQDYLAKRSRLESMLETNKASATTEQKIASLEKQIAELSKGMPSQAGSVENKMVSLLQLLETEELLYES